jgi:hypothetical protein
MCIVLCVNQIKHICLLKHLSFLYEENVKDPFFWLSEIYSELLLSFVILLFNGMGELLNPT